MKHPSWFIVADQGGTCGKKLIPGRELKLLRVLKGFLPIGKWKEANSRKGIETEYRQYHLAIHLSCGKKLIPGRELKLIVH